MWTGVAAAAAAAMVAMSMAVASGGDVTYDGRSLVVGGQRKILFSGSIHYPRSTPQVGDFIPPLAWVGRISGFEARLEKHLGEMNDFLEKVIETSLGPRTETWPSLIAKAKEGGLDAIQTYVFWNVHEPVQGQYNFQGRYDLVGFIKQIQAQGLYVSLRIGPFIESEWKYGGFPFWLHDVPGIIFRSDNEPFKYHMQRFTSMIVNLMKSEGLYASQGGPIILSQIENEYKNVEPAFHERGPPYVRWAAAMAVGLTTGVPWMMCKQDDAPDPVINACNGMNCGETFAGPNSPNKPALWTENWTSMYQKFGAEPYMRLAEDIAFATALFVAKGGSFVNYYMYHGGTNFGGFASSYVTTSYYDQAPLDEYGLIRQPKWGHLKELHAAVKSCSDTLLYGTHTNFSLGPSQEANVFQGASGKCAAFLSNSDRQNNLTVRFLNLTYVLPARSISILPDCHNVVFNTAKVSMQQSVRLFNVAQTFNLPERWVTFNDDVTAVQAASFTATGLLEQMSTTKGDTDYLWYSTSYEYSSSNNQPVLHVESQAPVVHAFINGVFIGNAYQGSTTTGVVLEKNVILTLGKNSISLLSVMVGLPDSGAYLEHKRSGIQSVAILGTTSGKEDISQNIWGYQRGLQGEMLKIYTQDGSVKINWRTFDVSTQQRLMWFKTTFDAPPGSDPMAIDLGSMGKGVAWVNGESIGRYWVSLKTPKGQPSQSLYHIPRSFLKPYGNLLVLFEEENGDPLRISINTIPISGICNVELPLNDIKSRC